MNTLNFYTVDNEYIYFLQKSEEEKRGMSRVPNLDYGKDKKKKFLCGVVLKVNNHNYFVPVTSYKEQKPDNFLIRDKNQKVVSSLRFNYMFPIPIELIKERTIDDEKDRKYRSLLSQELRYCIQNQEDIMKKALRTYKRVTLGKDRGLVHNSCDFKLLEEKSLEYKRNILDDYN